MIINDQFTLSCFFFSDPSKVKLETKGDLSFFNKQDEVREGYRSSFRSGLLFHIFLQTMDKKIKNACRPSEHHIPIFLMYLSGDLKGKLETRSDLAHMMQVRTPNLGYESNMPFSDKPVTSEMCRTKTKNAFRK